MGRADQAGDRWCILRTNGQRTLLLAKSLNEAALEAWTPEQTQWRAKTRRKPAMERQAPIFPTFVFVRERHVGALLYALRQPVNPHPAFSIMRGPHGFAMVDDALLSGLRDAEAAATRSADARRRAIAGAAARTAKDGLRHALPIGVEVAVPGPFAGFTGLVMSSTRREARLILPGGFRLKIDTWLMAEDVAEAFENA